VNKASERVTLQPMAKTFAVMASRVRAGEPYQEVLADYGFRVGDAPETPHLIDNTYVKANGNRICRTCGRLAWRANTGGCPMPDQSPTPEAPVRVRRCPVCHEPLLLIQRDPPSTAVQTGAWVPYCRLCQMEIAR